MADQTIAPPTPLIHCPLTTGGTFAASRDASSASILLKLAALSGVTPSCQFVGVYAAASTCPLLMRLFWPPSRLAWNRGRGHEKLRLSSGRSEHRDGLRSRGHENHAPRSRGDEGRDACLERL